MMMKRFKTAVLTLIIGLMASAGAAMASVADLPLTLRGGKTVHYYEVQPKETIYSISNKLGITKEYLIECNPEIADGLKAYSTLYFPLQTDESKSRTITHVVKKGETIYGLGKKLGVSPETLIEQNPSIADGLRVGQTVTVTFPGLPDSSDKTNVPVVRPAKKSSDTVESHVVKPGETFYSIARSYGLTPSQLEDANPTVGVLKAGDVIYIPDPDKPRKSDLAETTPQAPSVKVIPEPKKEVTPEPKPEPKREITDDGDDTYYEAPETPDNTVSPKQVMIPPKDTPVSIAVMLPFMLNQKSPDKTARRMTEFLRGMLMAVDTLKTADRPIRIYAYDTSASDDSVRAILRKPELKSMQVIIGPDNEEQFDMIAAWGADNDVKVFNAFLVKNTLQDTNPAVMQSNIPTPELTAKAIHTLLARFPDHTPVLVRRKDGPTDKTEVTDILIKDAGAEGRNAKELTYIDRLKSADLQPFETGDWLFIPVSGRQAELDKILPALAKLAEDSESPEQIILAGYPEWISFRGHTLENMKKVNTVVYTRFYCDEEDFDARNFSQSFENWYKHQPEAGLPRQAMLGYDIAQYLIKALRANGGDFSAPTPAYTGIQTSFDFLPAGSGMVNSAAYLLNFRPQGVTDRWPL